jgi:hypothetical protein
MENNTAYGGFAACYIASTLTKEEIKQEIKPVVFVKKDRPKRKYTK